MEDKEYHEMIDAAYAEVYDGSLTVESLLDIIKRIGMDWRTRRIMPKEVLAQILDDWKFEKEYDMKRHAQAVINWRGRHGFRAMQESAAAVTQSGQAVREGGQASDQAPGKEGTEEA